jgi:hypothetical protein
MTEGMSPSIQTQLFENRLQRPLDEVVRFEPTSPANPLAALGQSPGVRNNLK